MGLTIIPTFVLHKTMTSRRYMDEAEDFYETIVCLVTILCYERCIAASDTASFKKLLTSLGASLCRARVSRHGPCVILAVASVGSRDSLEIGCSGDGHSARAVD